MLQAAQNGLQQGGRELPEGSAPSSLHSPPTVVGDLRIHGSTDLSGHELGCFASIPDGVANAWGCLPSGVP